MQIRRKQRRRGTRFPVLFVLLSICAALLFYTTLKRVSKNGKGALRAEDELDTTHHSHVYDVLIVGSGWSGLGAATTLRDEGLQNFEILEARDYVGGRSRTVYPFTEDLAVEMGSAFTYKRTFVHGILEENNIPFGKIQYDMNKTFGLYQSGHFEGQESTGMEVSGEITGDERKLLIDKVWWDDFVPFSNEKYHSIVDHSDEKDFPYVEVLNEFVNRRDYATNSKSRQFLQAMLDSQIRVEYAASFDELATSYVGNRPDDCVFCSAIYYIPVKGGGFDKVLAHLADPLKEKIRLQSVVTRIEHHDDQPARVTYVDATDGTTHTKLAKRVLVTVPLGVLKARKIEFVPSLPDWKQEAIDLVGFGVLNKCIFYWETDQDSEHLTSWWPYGKDYMTLVRDQDATSGMWTTFFNDLEIGNGGEFVLSSWVGGDKAEAIESQSDETIVKQVLGNLRAMLGENVPEPSKYVITRWRKDEFALGSYSYYGVGGKKLIGPARKDLAKTVGKRLFWAGEATTTSGYGTTFGAHKTGVKAAKRIQESLSSTAYQSVQE